MQFRALSFGAVLGFAMVVVSSCQCGPQMSRCGANNCEGCCTTLGECVAAANTSDSACGNQGNLCSNCSMNGQTCNKTTNSCIGNLAGGGSAGGGAAGGATGGGSVGGGMAGGATAGGAAGGMSGTNCNILTNPVCPAGSQCLLAAVNGMTGDGVCVPGECSVLGQDCTAPNTKCTVQGLPDGGAGRLCTPFTAADGGLADNAPCTQTIPDPCQRGAQCLALDNSAAVCRRYCGPMNACGMGDDCANVVGFTTATRQPTPERHPICAAVISCEPLTQSPCGPAEACAPTMMGARCVMAGPSAPGAACGDATNSCARGATCVLPSLGAMMGTCRTICNLDGGMPTCAAGMCQGLQGATFGACSM